MKIAPATPGLAASKKRFARYASDMTAPANGGYRGDLESPPMSSVA
jgi:hypothetical protein